MRRKITFPSYVFLVPIVLVVLIFPAKSGLAAQLAEVRIGSSDISFSNFSTFYARDRGLFEREGIDAKLILVKTEAAVAAQSAGDLDYTTFSTSVIDAAVKGIPARLVAIWDTYQPNFPKLGVSPLEYEEFSRQTDIFDEVARYRYVAIGKETNLTGGSEARRVQPTCVSSSLFPLLEIHPLMGRSFQPADDSPNAPAIVLPKSFQEPAIISPHSATSRNPDR